MLKKFLYLTAFLSLLSLIFGCNAAENTQTRFTSPTPIPTKAKTDSSFSRKIIDYPFLEGIKQATIAAELNQSASSNSAWQVVANRWNKAICLMKKVPNSDANYTTAQNKIKRYQDYQKYAIKQAKSFGNIEEKETIKLAKSLLISIAKEYRYRPQIINWKTEKALAVPDKAWDNLSEAQISLFMDYAQSLGAKAIVTGKVTNSRNINIERKVLSLPSKLSEEIIECKN